MTAVSRLTRDGLNFWCISGVPEASVYRKLVNYVVAYAGENKYIAREEIRDRSAYCDTVIMKH
jgi:hypothetical protein